MNKVRPAGNSFNICQKPRIRIDYIMSLKKPNPSKTHMEQSVECNFFKKFKVIASLPILRAYCRFFFFFKDFSENPVNLDGHMNLYLINWTVQDELSKLNFNFDDIRTYFLHVVRDCRQITFNTLNGFRPLNKKNPCPCS